MLQEAAANEFRPTAIHMDGTIQGLALVLCNDKPQTFGAPDVLRLSIDQLALKYVVDQRFHDRPADQVPHPWLIDYLGFRVSDSIILEATWKSTSATCNMPACLLQRSSVDGVSRQC